MFDRLRNIFKTDKINELAKSNRIRFDTVHSDKRFNFLETVYSRLIAGDTRLTDDEIIESYLNYSNHIQTNSFSAAELEWVTISVLCYYRPHLIQTLIRRGLMSIVYSIGDNIDYRDVLEFIKQRILADNVEPYGGIPSEPGLIWLRDILPTQYEIVQRILTDVIEENKRELNEK